MPHTDPDLRDDPDAWLDRLLVEDAAQHRDAYVDDAGFTARVMDALPGAALDVSREAFRLLAAQPISLSAVAAALVAFGVATWTGAAWVMRRD